MKKVAVRVVLYDAVYLELIRLPRSKMIFCGSFQSGRKFEASLTHVHMIPFVVGSAVDVRQISVSFRSIVEHVSVDPYGMTKVIGNVHIIASLESS